MRLFECKRHLGFDILASHGKASAPARTATAAKQAFEEITKSTGAPPAAKEVAEVAKLDIRTFPVRRRPEVLPRFPVRPKLVVFLALVGIGQNLVSFVYLFKLLFGGFISRIDVGMILARQLAIRALDFILSC